MTVLTQGESVDGISEEQSHIARTALPDGQYTPAHSSHNKAVPGPEGVPSGPISVQEHQNGPQRGGF